jgi:hypothetical protein
VTLGLTTQNITSSVVVLIVAFVTDHQNVLMCVIMLNVVAPKQLSTEKNINPNIILFFKLLE